jgi:protease-4
MNHRRLHVFTALLTPLVITGLAFGQFDELKKLGRKALGSKEEESKQIAYFKLTGSIAETPVEMPPLFEKHPPVSMKSLLERFKQARLDNNVVAIVVDLQDAAPGFGQLEELHTAMRQFSAVDKPVFVYAESLRTITYAAATGASRISMVPTGDLWLTGLYGEAPYLRGTLEKMGCTPDFEHFGDYKSASEMFMRTGPSDEAKEMDKWLLDGVYAALLKRIADSRGMTTEKVSDLVDRGPYSAEEALKAGLIDSVQYKEDFIADLEKRYGDEAEFVSDYGKKDDMSVPEDPFAMFAFLMKLFNPTPKVYTEPSVAIVYVEGLIMTGESEPSPFGGPAGAFSTTIRRALDKAADDDTVKAVIMRVDSPGGSALASEIILNASRRVAAKKPLIVSMGNVAGSGGYYVTCASETIFADPSTITASIGVLGGKIVTTGMWDKLGVNWHESQRGKMAGMLSSAEKFNEEERAKIRHYMGDVYEVFKGHVTKARGSKLAKPLDQLAGGRVFTGAQALELGLVDKMGGLEDAIKFAAEKAGLGEYDIRVIPEPPSILDMFMKEESEDYASTRAAASSMFLDTPMIRELLPLLARIDPLRVHAIVRQLQMLGVVQTEGVVLAMPGELVIH